MQQQSNLFTHFFDKCGIWISALCAVHCLLLPIAISLLPIVAGSMFVEEWFERTILLSSIGIGAIAMLNGYFKHHGSLLPLGLLIIGALIYWFKDVLGEKAEVILVIAGAALIIYGHVRNMAGSCNSKRCSIQS